jgi:hypothetical protein
MGEDIITELSRFQRLFVIARNTSFTYKGRSGDVKKVARELGVHFVLEGSVRKADNRVRITGARACRRDRLARTAPGRHDTRRVASQLMGSSRPRRR